MKLGIKVGPADWKEKLSLAKYEAVEVYFRPNNLPQYTPLFEYLKKKKILTGLHFWGILKNGYFPNFAINNPDVLNESLSLFEETVDIANQWKFNYVLTHPFSCDLWKVNSNDIFRVKKSDISWKKGFLIMETSFKEINEYSNKKGVVFVLEQTIKNEPINWGENNSGDSVKVRTPSPNEMESIAKQNVHLALDFAHIATWPGPAKRELILKYLRNTLLKLKPYAHVIHLGSIKPPFMTDTGNGFTPQEDNIGILPSSRETLELLKIFKDTDVIVIPEPQRADHLWHNQFLKKSDHFKK